MPRRPQPAIFCKPAGGLDLFLPIPNTDRRHPLITNAPHVFAAGGYKTVTVPAGFQTDLASVPRWLLWLFVPFDDHQRASLLHDYLYREQIYSRFAADSLFRIWLEIDRVPCWRTWLLFYAVRCFGWIAWRSNAKTLAARRAKEVSDA